MQHRRRADVSREECPVPFCSGVASLVNIVDRVLDEGAVLRSKAASELLRRVAAAKKSILAAEEQQKVNNDRTSTAISSPGTAASPVFRLNAAVQGFSSNSVMSLDAVQQELEELQEIANEHPHLASPTSHVTTFPSSTKPTAIAVDDAGYAASRGAGEGASPTTKAKTTRMKRAGSRVVFTRSRSQQQQQQGPSSRGGSPRVVGMGSFASRASSTRVGPHVNEPDAA
ncbi:Hypothetical protein, putative [Bodo saltans]|uniref:Uncharacterized protein n=1 Tax=Bodo saltans TaxID=75058 RepID=A0A0S4IK27_BODSA|nr:Hypothetical protein, putative [Bodo saltans]|eukprot:CUE60029.1 Hypothetical protein, putative [Bodo saltans]